MYTVRVMPLSFLSVWTMGMILGLVPAALQAQPNLTAAREAVQSMALATGGTAEITHSPTTGLVNFVTTTADQPLPLGKAAQAPASERALAFVQTYGKAFGLQDASQVHITRTPQSDELGMEHVRLQQRHQGIPVTAGEMTVHLRDASVVAVLARTLPDLETVDTTPRVTPAAARHLARTLLTKHRHVTQATLSAPRLEIFNRGLLEDRRAPSRLAWFLEATHLALREFIWVDAHTGAILLRFSQLTDALNRDVYDAQSLSFLPGVLERVEGEGPSGNAEIDSAYNFAGDTYNYFFTQHGRDSFDNTGAPIISTVNYCEDPGDCPYANAFWDGVQMVYGAGFAAADDVVGHELTHAVTEHSANLFYYMQSGALNESYSDIFGETVDRGNSAGTDTNAVRWLLGEDLPIGAIRNMRNPGAVNDPGKVSDPDFVCAGSARPQDDQGGVHTNSGVPNLAYVLMVDGGTFNGITVTGIGFTKAAKIQYRALTRYLVSGSNFRDNYNALRQSCSDLVGRFGITAANCTEVKKALDAVEMGQPVCEQQPKPRLCPSGQSLTSIFQDDMENITSGKWRVLLDVLGPSPWNGCAGIPDIYCSGYASSGEWALIGGDFPTVADASVAMTRSFLLPTAGTPYLHFHHSYEFEEGFDGGVIEYSTNAGRTWSDARTLIDAGAQYDGRIDASTGNPLASRRAFTGNSFGYTATRLNLSTLEGRRVRFRFRLGTDGDIGAFGWAIDDVQLYRCQ